MAERTIVSGDLILSLPRHAKLRFDKARDKWIILAPERVFELDETAYEVISRCDGEQTVADVVNDLCKKYTLSVQLLTISYFFLQNHFLKTLQ